MAMSANTSTIQADAENTSSLKPRFEHVGFVPVALGILRQMKVAEFIDEGLEPKARGPQYTIARSLGEPPPLQGPTPGQCVEAMVVSILEAGRVTLYAMEDWIRNLPVQDYWGGQVRAEHFTDDRLAATLDKLWDMGVDPTFSRIMAHSMTRFGLTIQRLHCDGSTVGLQGAYDLPDGTPGPVPLRGFSKDNKRDGKQFVIGATVQQEGIPLAFGVFNGNTTDHLIYREHMERIAFAVQDSNTTTFIADCKLCDQYCLGALYKHNMQVITLLPRSHASHADALDAAFLIPSEQWTVIEQRDSRSSDEPTIFRGATVPISMKLSVPKDPKEVDPKEVDPKGVDPKGVGPKGVDPKWVDPKEVGPKEVGPKEEPLFEAKTVEWTALVVHSSQLVHNHEAELGAEWKKAAISADKQLKGLNKERFETQPEAERALVRFLKETKCAGSILHGKVVEHLIELPLRRGRPRKDLPPTQKPTKQAWRVEVTRENDEVTREAAMKRTGLFVLVSSRAFDETFTPADALHQYREQFQVETAFRWLKQPGLVAPILLHTPTRIAALGLIFVIALAVYRIIQHRVRTGLARENTTIPGNNHQPTKIPTTAVLAKLFRPVHRIIMATPQGTTVWLEGLTPAHQLVLRLLELPADLGLSEKSCRESSVSQKCQLELRGVEKSCLQL